MAEDPRDEGRRSGQVRADVLTVTLYVYFLLLIVVVGGLLVLPALY
jgi:hypothetical protein